MKILHVAMLTFDRGLSTALDKLAKIQQKTQTRFKQMVCLKNTSVFWAGHAFFGSLQLLVDIWRFPKMGILPVHLDVLFSDFHDFFTIQLLGVLLWNPP